MRTKKTGTYFSVAAAAILVVVVGSLFPADAQATKRKKAHRTRSTAASQTIPTTSEPQIVSRASDYDSETRIVGDVNASDGLAADAGVTERDLSDITDRIKRIESGMKNGSDEKQKRLLLYLDILTRAEQRVESLRKQRFDLVEKESSIRTKLDQIDNDIRPETIERTVALAGTLRPEELRENRRKSLEIERRNLQLLLTDVQSTRTSLEQSVIKADLLVEKLRARLEKDIDAALAADEVH